MHLVTRVHFRSHDKDGGYTIRSAVPENPILHANVTALCLIERELTKASEDRELWKHVIADVVFNDMAP